MKLHCDIVEDLLPLYLDDVCSEQSKSAIEEHLQECEVCRKKLECTQLVSIPDIGPEDPVKDKIVKTGFRKLRLRWWASILIILGCIPFVLLGCNQLRNRGVAYTNLNELACANVFMSSIADGNYEKAFRYLDIEAKRQEWLQNWFDEEKLVNLETDGREKFCELGAKLEELGGIQSYEYIGVSFSGYHDRGVPCYDITYKIRFEDQESLMQISATNDGIIFFSCGTGYVLDTLSRFSRWSQLLWEDYQGCYYDQELKAYVFTDPEKQKVWIETGKIP